MKWIIYINTNSNINTILLDLNIINNYTKYDIHINITFIIYININTNSNMNTIVLDFNIVNNYTI